MKKLIFFTFLIVMLSSCSHKLRETQNKNVYPVPLPQTVGVSPVRVQPNATAFRMSGDFANNIAITLNSAGNPVYFPDPKDITADSAPIDLGDGWWLNRQGIGKNSVFTTYTFAEYATLPEVPTIQQLKNSIIPGAIVTEFIELPFKMNQATQDISLVKEYIKSR